MSRREKTETRARWNRNYRRENRAKIYYITFLKFSLFKRDKKVSMSIYKIHITKSWRKSISMRFDKERVLQVRAPKFMLQSQIDNFLLQNNSWIDKNFQKILENQKNKQYYLFGKPLKHIHEIQNLEKYYKQQAKLYIIPRCRELAEKHGFMYYGIRITSASTRWGSCSSKKTLNFSYRLIMSPIECIDYVVIHELCHLRQMNHSPRFWREVTRIMPDYKNYEKHLKSEGWKYMI